jgi:diphosphomevalonate decarboxylase
MEDTKKILGKVKWQSPSNIAIVKYWGKKDIQIPINPSISFSLSKSFTETEIAFSQKQSLEDISATFHFEGTFNKSFENKILKYLSRIKSDFQLFSKYHLGIKSKNTFPHSAGIASSASSMSALILCLLSIEHAKNKIPEDEFYRKASSYARMASGSACRSLKGGFSLWGETNILPFSSNDYAVQLSEIHPIFHDLQDAILIVDSNQKKVSSTEGHRLMENHPHKDARIKQANHHTAELIVALKKGDFNTFARISEIEAIGLHALMMTSSPSYNLMGTNSLNIIEKIKAFRTDSGLDLCFTMDAGPNVHLIYPKLNHKKITRFIEQELLVYCESDKWIADEMGTGSIQLKNTVYEQ